ncbi:RNA 3'-terminal phosphate cyclase [soil metagenome]
MITLDGAYGEGGGQILRTALVLSLLTGQPFRIENIRRGRPNPGLKAQHLQIVNALLQMSNSQVEGLQLGALALSYVPGQLRGGVYAQDIGTAGAIPLFLQTILPVALFADSSTTFTVTGGTDVRGAMTIDFWQTVLLPFLQPYAQRLELQVKQYGFYPAGGGEVKLRVAPRLDQNNWLERRAECPALTILARGALQQIRLCSVATQELSGRRVAERQASGFRRVVKFDKLASKIGYVDALSPGSSVTAMAEYEHTRLGADALGEKTKPAELVGQEAAQRLEGEMNATGTVDVHTADNLMLWIALFGGSYTFAQMTGHIENNAWTIEQFLPGALKIEENCVFGLPRPT